MTITSETNEVISDGIGTIPMRKREKLIVHKTPLHETLINLWDEKGMKIK